MNKIMIMATALLSLGLAACGNSEKKAEQQAEQTQLTPAEQRLAAGQEFLAENGKRTEVTTTPSGLQYEVLVLGEGPKPSATDEVEVHYEGRLIDGTVFDSSYQRGETIVFPLDGVIAGWTEGLQLMPVGSKYRLYIPANLAYGSRGAGGVIGPNEALIFDVELINIK